MPNNDSGKSILALVLNSTLLSTLASVLVGGLLVQWINLAAQEQIQDRQVKNTLLQEQGKQALITHREHLDRALQTIERAMQLTGTVLSASENLISLTKPEWSLKNFKSEAEKARTREQKAAIRVTFNTADEEWTQNRDSLGFLLSFYWRDGEDQAIAGGWEAVVGAVNGYRDCARGWYVQHLGIIAEDASTACNSERAAVGKGMRDLRSALGASGRFAQSDLQFPAVAASE